MGMGKLSVIHTRCLSPIVDHILRFHQRVMDEWWKWMIVQLENRESKYIKQIGYN